jgi:putative hydrolase of the HAD superfamily
MPATKNIIFDLGGVLLNIDTSKTNAAFEKLGVKGFSNSYSLNKADALFDELEKGMRSEMDFFNGIRNITGLPLNDNDIRLAWNALLLDFRTQSLNMLKQLKSGYKLYLLSNTNSIHHLAFHESFKKQTGEANFDDYFIKAYYSHHTGLRKPEKEIYEFVLKDAGIIAGETMFIDDLLKNIEPAQALGMQTCQLRPGEKIEDLQPWKIT